MPNKDKLKPCPFCGAKGKIVNGSSKPERAHYCVLCNKCVSATAWYKTKEKAIKAWNTRTRGKNE